MGPSRAATAAAAAMMLTIAANSFAPSAVVHAFVRPVLLPRQERRPTAASSSSSPSLATPPSRRRWEAFRTIIMTATRSDDQDLEREVSSMGAGEIRRELESMGIGTKSFLEKSELVDALLGARREGRTAAAAAPVGAGVGVGVGVDGGGGDDSAVGGASDDRRGRLEREMITCNAMKVGELKKELESYGVSTRSYFEKSEFVRAVAEARVDGTGKKGPASGGGGGGASSSSSSSSSSSGRAGARAKEEPRDPTYRDVIVTKFSGNKGLLEGKIFDVRAR
jgi:hypothetical protein